MPCVVVSRKDPLMPITVMAFTIAELSKDAKKRALEQIRSEKYRHDWDSDDIQMSLKEMFAQMSTEAGFPDMNVRYSLGCCQGDGVSMVGDIDFDALFAKDETLLQKYPIFCGTEPVVSAKIAAFSSNYVHANTMSVELTVDEWYEENYELFALAEATFDDLEGEILSKAKDVCGEMEKAGYAEIEYHDSDEYLEDMVLSNDWYFSRDGDVISKWGAP